MFSSADNNTYSKKQKKQFKYFTALLFVAVICIFISVTAVKILNSGSRERSFREAAGKVCSDIISEYGSCRIEASGVINENERWALSGISCVKHMDFNADGSDELFVAYSNEGTYFIEVWGFKGKEFINLYKDKVNYIEDFKNLGRWITIYSRGSKCYIGKIKENSTEEMDLFTLKGNEFKAVSSCGFNPQDMSYSVKGKININDFETIKLSGLTAARAEYNQNSVNDAISEFIGEKYVNSTVLQTDEQKMADAFCKVIELKNQKYGVPTVSVSDSGCFADGAAVVRLIDFDGDGKEELFVISRNKSDFNDTDATPQYIMDVFSWDRTTARKVFESRLLSSYFDNSRSDVFYILQKKNGKVNICSNTYSYGENPGKTWRAVSTINEMTSSNGFETTFTAIINSTNGYKTYRLNGKSSYKREFEKEGYAVAYFCNEDDYNKDEFEVVLLNTDESGKKAIEALITETQETVKRLYSVKANQNVIA